MNEKIVSGILVREIRPNVWVSSCGKVWLEHREKPSKSKVKKYMNYWHLTNSETRVKILIDGKQELRYRLVAEAWLPNPSKLPIINHLDGISINDNVDNLEWCDVSRNTQHAYDIGLNVKVQSNENLRTMTDGEEQEIHQRYLASKAKNRLDEISKAYGISRSLLKKINRKWR